MRRSPWGRWLLAGGLLVAGVGFDARACLAAEECQRFLDGLRQRGYFDMALEYLEQMRTSPLASQQFKAMIDYEAGVTLKDSARTGRARSVREKQLDEARVMFKRFLAEQPEHPLAAGGNTQLANLLVERGKLKVEQAADAKTSAQQKKQLREEAQALYGEAEQVFGRLEEYFLAEYRKFDKFLKDPKKIEAKDHVRRNLFEARISSAQMLEEMSKAHEPGSADHKKCLEGAAAKYQKLYDNYGGILVGLYAHMWEGRCYRELGRIDDAFVAFQDLLAEPDESPPFRLMKNRTMILFLETALLPAVRKYKMAIDEADQWEKEARGQDETSPEGLAVKCLAGEVAFEYARSFDKKQSSSQNADARRAAMTKARKLLMYVAGRPGEYQRQAKALLRRKEFAGEDASIPEPANYAEAGDRARDAFELMQDPQLKPDELAAARADAIEYYRMAFRLKPADVEAEELNVMRYHLAYLYWASGDVYEAAVLGEFLARRYSGGLAARPGAKIAMAAYVRLFNEAPPDDRQFENDRMIGIAKYVAERWAGEPEGDEAWMTLISTALKDGDLPTAQQYLANISADSPRRGKAELMTGQRLWAAYLAASRKPEDERPDQAQLDEMVEQAQQTLENGIQRMRKPVDEGADIDYTLVASVLSLAQISIGANQPDQAVKWLQDPKVGALTLVKSGHPATDRGNFAVETYKAALRAYVATQQLDKADKVMKALEQQINKGGDAAAAGKLTRIYISLGRELQDQLERLGKQGNNQGLQRVSQGFEKFLDQILQREEGNTFNSLNWVAETFFGLGKGFDTGGSKLPDEAKKYYEKAAKAYGNILTLCSEKKIEFQPGATTSISIRLAKCFRRLGEYAKARDLLKAILKDRATMVDAQIEAAYTYQAWGAEKSAAYNVAIMGYPDGNIWGWGLLARKVYGNQKYRSVFHEARYNLALCRLKYAQTQKSTKKKALLLQAEKDITNVQRQFPAMGRKQGWYDKYDVLLKKIQSLRGVKVTGLTTTAKKTSSTR